MTGDVIALTIESILWDHEGEPAPPGLEYIDLPDRCFWCCQSDSPLANRVVRAVFTPEIATEGIGQIVAFYQERERPFSWWVGPSSRPLDLRHRLAASGLSLMDVYEGVGLEVKGVGVSDTTLHARPHPDFQVIPVTTEGDLRSLIGISAAVWGYSRQEVSRVFAERLNSMRRAGTRAGYLIASLGGEPAGCASYRFSSSGEAMYLNGGAVLPGFRRRGVYSALLQARLGIAAGHGCKIVTSLARRGTSLPILIARGFTSYFEMPVYSGGPAQAEHCS